MLEGVLENLMFTVPSDSTVEKIIITEDSVKNGSEPIILRNANKTSKILKASDLKNA